MISPLFTTIVIGAGFLWVFMKLTTKSSNQTIDEFLERERLSNSVRKQPLDNLEYISVNPDDFPIPNPAPNERIDDLFNRLKTLSQSKIVNLTGISNTDLKMTYGVANLTALTEYDQNFTTLCRTIYDLGIEMSAIGYTNEAMTILQKGVNFGTDISGNYLLLADIYIQLGQPTLISNLIKKAENIKSLTKESTISKLNIKFQSTNGVLINDADGSVSSLSPDNILPKDILDILETVPYKSDGQTQ